MDRALHLLTVLRGFPVGSGNRVTDGIRLTVDSLTSRGGPQRIVGGEGSNVTDRAACAYLKPRLPDTLIADKDDAVPSPQISTNCAPPWTPEDIGRLCGPQESSAVYAAPNDAPFAVGIP